MAIIFLPSTKRLVKREKNAAPGPAFRGGGGDRSFPFAQIKAPIDVDPAI
jgi:hypothetical protein